MAETTASTGSTAATPAPTGQVSAQAKGSATAQVANGKGLPNGSASAASANAPQAEAVAEAMAELGEADLNKLVTVKINGETKKLPVRELMKLSSLEQASQARMREAAQAKNQAMQVMQLAKSNPKEFLRLTGMDPYQFAESTLAEKLQELAMTPEQRELSELKAYKEKSDREKAEIDRKAKQEASQREIAQLQGQYNKDFVQAWQKTGLPPDPVFGKWMASEMASAIDRGENLSWDEAAGRMMTVVDEFFPRILEAMESDRFQRVLGPKNIDRVREIALSRVTQGAPTANSGKRPDGFKKPAAPSAGKKQKSNGLSEREWDAAMRAKLR